MFFVQVKREVGFQKDMLSMLGAMDGVVCAAGNGRGGDTGGVTPHITSGR